MGSTVSGYVVLKGVGVSLSADPPGETRRPAEPTAASKETQESVKRELRKLGFHVRRSSPLSVIVDGSLELFEKVFDARIGHSQPVAPQQKGSGAQPAGLSWATAPKIPEELAEDVEAVVFPQPVTLIR